MAIFWAVCAAFLASGITYAITRARVRADCMRVLRLYDARSTAQKRRYRWAEWWARNAAETNTDEIGRWALMEIALLTLCSESTGEVAVQVRNSLATSRAMISAGLEPNEAVRVARNTWLDSIVGELELKRPKTDEPWDAWDKLREECPQASLHNAEALKWFRGALAGGRYGQLVTRYQAAVGMLWVLESSQPGISRQLMGGQDSAGLLPEIEKRGQSNSRLLPYYGENPV